jgi:hypothetical protein
MAHLTRDEILAKKVDSAKPVTVELPSGGTVAVRPLTRNEVLRAGEASGTTAERDDLIVSMGMVDPVMSADDVHAWGEAGAAGDLVAISDAIGEISGLKQGAGKSGVARPRKRR